MAIILIFTLIIGIVISYLLGWFISRKLFSGKIPTLITSLSIYFLFGVITLLIAKYLDVTAASQFIAGPKTMIIIILFWPLLIGAISIFPLLGIPFFN
ncbi:MAG: hypothetical protein AAB512_00845 [Patescibacteria group bacterium]